MEPPGGALRRFGASGVSGRMQGRRIVPGVPYRTQPLPFEYPPG